MGKEIINFWDTYIEKHKFPQHKNLILIYGVDINKMKVSRKFPFGKKRF